MFLSVPRATFSLIVSSSKVPVLVSIYDRLKDSLVMGFNGSLDFDGGPTGLNNLTNEPAANFNR